MKYIIPFLLLLLFACKKEDSTTSSSIHILSPHRISPPPYTIPTQLAGVYAGYKICSSPNNWADTTNNESWTIVKTGDSTITVDGDEAVFSGMAQNSFNFNRADPSHPFQVSIDTSNRKMQMFVHIGAGESCESVGYK